MRREANGYILHSPDTVSIPVELEEKIEGADSALLGGDAALSPERYPTSQFHQFWTVLKRTLLFSRRDWVLILILPKAPNCNNEFCVSIFV